MANFQPITHGKSDTAVPNSKGPNGVKHKTPSKRCGPIFYIEKEPI